MIGNASRNLVSRRSKYFNDVFKVLESGSSDYTLYNW